MKQHNEMVQGDLLDQTKKYEEDRIGKGKFARGIANSLDFITLGRAGDTIGKPADKSVESQKYNGAYQNAKQVSDKKNSE